MDLTFLDALATHTFNTLSPEWTIRQVCEATYAKTRWTPALNLIEQALVDAFETPNSRVILSMPPQEGKSTLVSMNFPIWCLMRNPELRIVTGSYAQSLANRNGRTVRNHIKAHPEFGLAIAADNGAASEWTLEGHRGGLLAVGRGAGVVGRPADLLIVDDPLKDRKEADSPTIRQTVIDWWTDALANRLSPGASAIVMATRWHEDDLSGWLAKQGGWTVLNIPAQADHNPAEGETDPLGREPGEFMLSAQGRTLQEWELRKREAGSRAWASLFQGRPSPGDGDLFKREWFTTTYWEQQPWVQRSDGTCITTNPGDQLLISVDATFKGEDKKNHAERDYVAMGVWLRRGIDVYLLDLVHDVLDFVQTCDALVALAAKWPQAVLKIIEDKANGPAIMAQLARQVPGMVPEEPQGGKQARANAIAPFCEAGQVHLPHPTQKAWSGEVVEQLAAFPRGRHDDIVDQLTQAVNRLLLQPLYLDEDTNLVQASEFEEYDATGYVYSRF